MREKIPGADMRVASAYFSIYAHQELREELERAQEFKFLFGDPRSIGNVDPGESDPKHFVITDQGDLGPAATLTQKIAARNCAEWVRQDNVHIRTMESEFLHGKMFHLQPPEGPSTAVCGSSNFTCRGLGFGRGNRELNIVADEGLRRELCEWFDELWDGEWSKCAEKEMLKTLARIGEDKDPHFIYFLTLYRLFREELEKVEQSADRSRLEKSVIWEELYPFQRDAVSAVVSRMVRWGGCILADSVGLGKTYTALAVLKYFQNENALVLCPKRLEWNWKRFLGTAKGDNPLEQDNLRYEVAAHTDLGREVDHDWSKFDLVVIDESHHFRNHQGMRYKKLSEALKQGAKTKVLMLSATPVNTSLKDIRNQIHLMADDNAFAAEAGIQSVHSVARDAQAAYIRWKKTPRPDPGILPEHLGGVFLKLLDTVSVARSRRQVQEHYADSFVGGDGEGKKMEAFPRRAAPVIREPETGAGLSYAKIHGDIEKFGLSIYHPSAYLKPDSPRRIQMEAEQNKVGSPPFKQTDREKSLIGMMRINFLKRLESSAHSFCQTLTRTIKKIEDVEGKIARVHRGEETNLIVIVDDTSVQDELDEDGEMDEGFFLVGKGLKYDLRDIQLDNWNRDLKNDRKVLEDILKLAKKVTPARDTKLAELKKLLREKSENPTTDKDGKPNRKMLVFTTFADTAKYLYEQLHKFARDELKLHIGLVVGSGENHTTAKIGPFGARHGEILNRFSPAARQFSPEENGGDEIDILIATDCVSEGQNLQDCDTVINYDIHWNPVRIIQRFGRVDRIGGRNSEVRRVDFWPHMDLEEYLNLQKRVRAGMALANLVGPGEQESDEQSEDQEAESFRDRQLREHLKRLREGGEDALTADDLGQISVNDFIMSDLFLAELRAFLESKRKEMENAPNGLFAVVQSNDNTDAQPGIIFCLRRKNPGSQTDAEKLKSENRVHPYCLVYVRKGGNGPEIRLGFPRVKEILTLFRALCHGKTEPLRDFCAAFDKEIQSQDGMKEIRDALDTAADSIVGQLREGMRKQLTKERGAQIPKKSEQPKKTADFELISWLVIRDKV